MSLVHQGLYGNEAFGYKDEISRSFGLAKKPDYHEWIQTLISIR